MGTENARPHSLVLRGRAMNFARGSTLLESFFGFKTSTHSALYRAHRDSVSGWCPFAFWHPPLAAKGGDL